MKEDRYNNYGCLLQLIWGVGMLIILPYFGYRNDFDSSDWLISIVVMVIILLFIAARKS